MVEKTTIEVRRETWRRLNAEKLEPGESFDTVVRRLLDRPGSEAAESADSGRSAGAEGEGERVRCEHCGHVWTTKSESERPTCSKCTKKTDRLAP